MKKNTRLHELGEDAQHKQKNDQVIKDHVM